MRLGLLLIALCAVAQAPAGNCAGQAQQLTEITSQVTQAEKDIVALRVELAESRGGHSGRLNTLERLAMIVTLAVSVYAVTRKQTPR